MSKFFQFVRYSCESARLLANLNTFKGNKISFNNFASSSLRHTNKMPRYEYPSIRRDESIVDNFHGVEVNMRDSIKGGLYAEN